MAEAKHKDPDWLRTQYYENGLSVRKMARLARVSPHAIQYQCEKHGIELRSLSEAKKLQWQDPEYRAEVSAALRRHMAEHPEHMEALRAGWRRYWADPEARKKQSDFMRRRWNTKSFRRKVGWRISCGLKRAWADGRYAFVHYVPKPGSFEIFMRRLLD